MKVIRSETWASNVFEVLCVHSAPKVRFNVELPDDYPMEAPKIRLVDPQVKATEFLSIEGYICQEVLPP